MTTQQKADWLQKQVGKRRYIVKPEDRKVPDRYKEIKP